MPKFQNSKSELFYEVYGTGAPIVLAHGMGGNHAIWHKQIPDLAKDNIVITFDHRGFGNSEDIEGVSRGGFVDDLKSLLDHLEVEKTTLVGQSMGGGICVCFTCQYPERVSSLVIADSLHGFEEPDDVAVVMDKSRQETSSLSQLERVLGAKVRNEDPVAGILYSALNSFNATNRSNLSGSYGPKCTPEKLAATGVPILFVAGSEDVLFPVEAISLLQARVTGSELKVFEDTGHSAFYENPTQFNHAIKEILASAASSGSS